MQSHERMVVIVDDEPEIITTLTDVLEKLGIKEVQSFSATHFEDAKLSKGIKPDLVIAEICRLENPQRLREKFGENTPMIVMGCFTPKLKAAAKQLEAEPIQKAFEIYGKNGIARLIVDVLANLKLPEDSQTKPPP